MPAGSFGQSQKDIVTAIRDSKEADARFVRSLSYTTYGTVLKVGTNLTNGFAQNCLPGKNVSGHAAQEVLHWRG